MIKYRAWNKKKKDWSPFYVDCNIVGIDLRKQAAEEGLELVMFIGQHDNKGKEIYEGDIIKCPWKGIGYVYWDSEYRIHWKYFDDIFGKGYAKGVEIIGNIYENPELLESK
jgi:hypothetical protein